MPAPSLEACYEAVRQRFRLCQIQHPMDWNNPGHQFPEAFDREQLQVAANDSRALFREASLHQYHVNGSLSLSQEFDRFIYGICAAFSGAISMWLSLATVSGVTVNGNCGLLPPGGLRGPCLKEYILENTPSGTRHRRLYAQAAATAFSRQWRIWQHSIQGQLAYPALAAWPGPQANGVANTPITVGRLGETGLLSGPVLYTSLRRAFADDRALHSRPLFYALGFGLAEVLEVFLNSTVICQVLASGPVPVWNPPAVPAGPVVGGSGIGVAGCIR